MTASPTFPKSAAVGQGFSSGAASYATKQSVGLAASYQVASFSSGPWPIAAEAQIYEILHPGSFKKIMDMTDDDQKHAQALERDTLAANIKLANKEQSNRHELNQSILKDKGDRDTKALMIGAFSIAASVITGHLQEPSRWGPSAVMEPTQAAYCVRERR
jgi:uncharacterized membrane protein